MFFTQDDYKKIQQWLIKNSVKDTEFNEANIPFNGEETITIVQGNQNKKVFLKDLIAQVFNLGISDFVNITDKYDAPNISLEEAIRLIPSRARKEGQVVTFLDREDHWHIYQFKGALNQWNVLDTWEDLFDWEKLIIDSILPDEEDLTKSLPDENGNSYLSLKDREYNPEDFSGLGRIILRKNIVDIEDPIYGKVKKNILYQEMFTQSNTIYECRYDFDLNGKEINIPENCVLKFEGGSLSNGNLTFNKTYLDGNVKIDNILPSGSLANYEVHASWFGVSSQKEDNHDVLQSLVNMVDCLIIEGIYKISKSLTISRKISLRGLRDKEHVYAIYENDASCGIKITSNAHCIILDDNAEIKVRALALLGNKDLYIANGTHEDVMMAGIYQHYKGVISVFDRSSIMGFTYGIYSVGAHITEITNSWFSACRFGLYTKYTSDYSVTGCSFNTCMLNYDHNSHSLAVDDPYSIKNVGGGVKVNAGGMIKFVANRFEWNFINFIIDEMAVQMLVNDNIFDAATYAHVVISNPISNQSVDLSNMEYAIDGLTFANNTINKGAGLGDWLAGESIFYIESTRDRKVRFSLIGNVVADEIGDVVGTDRLYEEKLFSLLVQDSGKCTIISEGNDFARCKAPYAFSAINGSAGIGSFVYKDSGSDFGNMTHDQWHNIFDVQKMEVLPDHTIKIWNTYSDGSAASQDIIFNPIQPKEATV